MPIFAPLVLLGQVTATVPDLSAAAAASPRPMECRAPVTARDEKGSPWDSARRPGLASYCRLLARGYARLSRSPGQALMAAEKADKALAGRAPPKVLAARALMASGQAAPAFERFQKALAVDPRAVRQPAALHDYAVAAALSGHDKIAADAYRRLVPRAGLLASDSERQLVYVEAALGVMRRGPDGVSEAIGYLTEARRRGAPPGLSDIVLGALALALSRQGRVDEARGVAAEAGASEGLAEWLRSPKRVAGRPRGVDAELLAVVATLAEADDPEAARDAWKDYLATPAGTSGPWREHAKKELAAAGKRGR
ncbi:MAG: hypothetical protein KC776_09800 [Myxococcales bacterium]|nr:hypothetical protein [Myxococcales bacterium]